MPKCIWFSRLIRAMYRSRVMLLLIAYSMATLKDNLGRAAFKIFSLLSTLPAFYVTRFPFCWFPVRLGPLLPSTGWAECTERRSELLGFSSMTRGTCSLASVAGPGAVWADIFLDRMLPAGKGPFRFGDFHFRFPVASRNLEGLSYGHVGGIRILARCIHQIRGAPDRACMAMVRILGELGSVLCHGDRNRVLEKSEVLGLDETLDRPFTGTKKCV